VRYIRHATRRVRHRWRTQTQLTKLLGIDAPISTMALVPQVVDAIAPVPVLAAGGIAEGRGLAAALVLGRRA
jgi:NAD(P)H-dependent flavin oxidoreductase YrpB (nitropropane dioxygenase family)